MALPDGYQIMKYGFDGFSHIRSSMDVPKEWVHITRHLKQVCRNSLPLPLGLKHIFRFAMPPTPKKNTRSSPRRFINRFLPLRMVVCDLPGKFGIFAALWDRYMYIYCFVPRGLSAEERSSRNKESLYTPSLYHIAVGNRLYVFLFFFLHEISMDCIILDSLAAPLHQYSSQPSVRWYFDDHTCLSCDCACYNLRLSWRSQHSLAFGLLFEHFTLWLQTSLASSQKDSPVPHKRSLLHIACTVIAHVPPSKHETRELRRVACSSQNYLEARLMDTISSVEYLLFCDPALHWLDLFSLYTPFYRSYLAPNELATKDEVDRSFWP